MRRQSDKGGAKAMMPRMPVKAEPFRHQREAFEFACGLLGLAEGRDDEGTGGEARCGCMLKNGGGDGDGRPLCAMRESNRTETQPNKEKRE